MIDNIMYTFDKNFGRLNNLIGLYESISEGRGRKSTNSLDLLRATTVLVHSTMEDYLRSLMAWRLPLVANRERLNQIPLTGTSDIGRRTKFELGELSNFRGRTIDEVIEMSIKEYLGTLSYNNTADIASSLTSISVNVTEEIRELFPRLNEMILRRHNIVHRADRDMEPGVGRHRIKSIGLRQVNGWKNTLDKFVVEINKNF